MWLCNTARRGVQGEVYEEAKVSGWRAGFVRNVQYLVGIEEIGNCLLMKSSQRIFFK